MSTTKHEHEVSHETAPRIYRDCASPNDCWPASHGNVTMTQVCSCGRERTVNRNCSHEEHSAWRRAVTS